VTWKVLAALLLLLPTAAYVVGTMVGPPEVSESDRGVTAPESPTSSARPSTPVSGPDGPAWDEAGGTGGEPRPPEVLGTQSQRPPERSSPSAQETTSPTQRPEPTATPASPGGSPTPSSTPEEPATPTPDDPTTEEPTPGTPTEPTASPTGDGDGGDAGSG
jgi:hypothetical protein